MKAFQLILLFALLCYCLSQDGDDQCQKEFNNILNRACTGINNGCLYNIPDKKCIQTNLCSLGDENESKCKTLVPSDFHKKNINIMIQLENVKKLPKNVWISEKQPHISMELI